MVDPNDVTGRQLAELTSDRGTVADDLAHLRANGWGGEGSVVYDEDGLELDATDDDGGLGGY